jgi:diketogulonate reductase-like aldo/keto reductase
MVVMLESIVESPRLVSLGDVVEIAPGVMMNRLGLGTYKANEGPDVEGEVEYGLSVGYRLIDTAALYGNEGSVGEALRASGIPRDELFVTTKLWNTEQGFDTTLAAFDASLAALKMDYVDLYLVHWPMPATMADTWRAMEEILASGRTRAIGVCNSQPHHLDELLATANIPPAVNQFEFHMRLQQPELVTYCREHRIAMQAWAPIMRGRVNLIPELADIAQRHRKTPAQISIRWILQQGINTIPKSVHSERIAENADVYGFSLSDAEMAAISQLDTAERIGPDPDRFG